MKIFWIYPNGPQASCPQAIGRNVQASLGRDHEVIDIPWDSLRRLEPDPEAVLIGHPHPSPLTVFRRSARAGKWKRVIAVNPYTHGDSDQLAYLDSVIDHVDLYLAITGAYWFRRVRESQYAHWWPKMRQLDLAVDRRDFPLLDRRFRECGARTFLYIGHAGWQKNTAYLQKIRDAVPEMEFGWIGGGGTLAGFSCHGVRRLDDEATRRLIAKYDFTITVGRSDANPATILESMALGLVPVCTPQSGYEDEPGIINVPLDDVDGAVRLLQQLQNLPTPGLDALKTRNLLRLEEHYNWDRFTREVRNAIESEQSPALAPCSPQHRAALARYARSGRLAPMRPSNLMALARSNAGRWLRWHEIKALGSQERSRAAKNVDQPRSGGSQ